MRKDGDLIRAIDLETVPSAAKRLGLTVQRVRQMIDEGKIDHYRFENRVMLHRRDVEREINRRRGRKRAS
jgi:excisionase family DNA binding protein